MNCPYCNHNDTKVIDSRETKDGNSIKRRRKCLNCQKRFTTIEKVLKLDIEIIKSSGNIEEFNLSKVRNSILKACEKRPITLEQIEIILENVLEDLKKISTQKIPTSLIGNIVLKNLKKFDEISFLKYAIVHNNYNSINEFIKQLDTLKNFKQLNYKKITENNKNKNINKHKKRI